MQTLVGAGAEWGAGLLLGYGGSGSIGEQGGEDPGLEGFLLGFPVGFLIGTAWLALRLRRCEAVALWPRTLPVVTLVTVVLAALAWGAVAAWAPDGRMATAVCLTVVSLVVGAAYYGTVRGLHLLPGTLHRSPVVAA